MAVKVVSQKKFAKLVASTGSLSQPPGSLPRLSNLLMTQRGSLQIADGSLPISAATLGAIHILWIDSFSNFKLSQFPYYPLIYQVPASQLVNVTGFSFTPSGSASNPAETYTFAIVNTLAGAHSSIATAGAFQTQTVGASFGTVTFNWTNTGGGDGYAIYLISGPSPFLGATAILVATAAVGDSSVAFTGVLPVSPVILPPIVNTAQFVSLAVAYVSGPGSMVLVAVTSGAHVFPGIAPLPAMTAPGSPSFNYSVLTAGYSPYGGVPGVACPIPESLEFAGKTVVALGNGLPPVAYDPSQLGAASPVVLANTFTAAYPSWQPAVVWLTGSQVIDGAGNFFTATQGGVSQTPGPPTWSTAKGTQTADGSIIWTSNGPVITPPAPRGAAHAVAYAGSLWLANTSPTDTADGIDGPSCIKMSDSNNPNSWNPVNTAFISRNDGTQITGMQPFTIAALGISPTGSLCVFKEFTTYQIIGVFGSSSFEIQPAQTNLGCIAARSIQFLPGFGVCRFAHLGFAVFDGINDRLISEDIRPYLFGGVDSEADLTPVDPSFVYLSHSAQTSSPPMYLCAMPLAAGPAGGMGSGMLTRLFCYDLVMKAWAVLDLPWPITTLSAVAAGEGYPLVLAGKTDGTLQRMQSGDLIWDTGAGDQSNVRWSFRSPDIFGEGSSQRLYYKTVVLRGYGNAAMVQSIVASLWIDGKNIGAQAIDTVPQGGSTLFECQIKIWLNGYRAHLDVSGNNGGGPGVIDALDWEVVPKATGTRRIIG